MIDLGFHRLRFLDTITYSQSRNFYASLKSFPVAPVFLISTFEIIAFFIIGYSRGSLFSVRFTTDALKKCWDSFEYLWRSFDQRAFNQNSNVVEKCNAFNSLHKLQLLTELAQRPCQHYAFSHQLYLRKCYFVFQGMIIDYFESQLNPQSNCSFQVMFVQLDFLNQLISFFELLCHIEQCFRSLFFFGIRIRVMRIYRLNH